MAEQQDHSILTYTMLSDRLRGVETAQQQTMMAGRDTRQAVHGVANQVVHVAKKVDKIDEKTGKVISLIETIIVWSKRILLSLGLVLLSGGHFTIDQIAIIAKKALGL